MPDQTVSSLNNLPISRRIAEHLKELGQSPVPDKLHALQLLDWGLEEGKIPEDLGPEVLFLLKRRPNEASLLLGLQTHWKPAALKPLITPEKTLKALLEMVEAVATEGDLPRNFL